MNKHLLLVHAHPDDETLNQGATMAKYVSEGVGVTLVTCTGGELGEILVPELEHLAADREDRLGEQRKQELAAAMAELGVTDHRYLGGYGTYRDSGMKWHEDGHAIPSDEVHENAFWNADLTEAADHLVAVIREIRPQVMVAYDEFGLYGHPDHIQAHRVATYAAALAAVPSYRRDLGEAHDIAKIYWGAMSARLARIGMELAREGGLDVDLPAFDPDGRMSRLFTEDEDLSAVIEAGEFGAVKLAALRAHTTQIDEDNFLIKQAEFAGPESLGVEYYRIAKGERGALNQDGLETDLFAGL